MLVFLFTPPLSLRNRSPSTAANAAHARALSRHLRRLAGGCWICQRTERNGMARCCAMLKTGQTPLRQLVGRGLR